MCVKIIEFTNEEDWKKARMGKITGTKVKELIVKRGNTNKAGFYKILAERIAIPPGEESPIDRGVRLEDDALALFAKNHKVKVDTRKMLICREDEENIAISPDGIVWGTEKDKEVIVEAVDAKCLNSENHIRIFLTQNLKEFEDQVLQYFVVIDTLKVVHYAFYDPRIPKDFFYISVYRKSCQEKIKQYLEFEREALKGINQIENDLTF